MFGLMFGCIICVRVVFRFVWFVGSSVLVVIVYFWI